MSTEKRRRGRPRKNPLPESTPEPVEINDIEPIEDPVNIEPEPTPEPVNIVENDTPFTGTQGTFNPLADNVVEREYATPKTIDTIVDDIPEPSFDSNPSFEELMNAGQPEAEPQQGAFDNPNEGYNQLDDHEQRVASEQLVDTFLDTYKAIKGMLVNVVKVDENKIAKLIMDDVIDGEMGIPTEDGEISLMEFAQTFNAQAEETLAYDEEWGAKIRVPLVKIFMRKGWGMTDDQYLYFLLGQEVLNTAMGVYTLKKSWNMTIKMLADIHTQNKEMIPDSVKPKPEPVRQSEPVREEDIQVIKPEVVEPVEEVPTKKMVIQEFKPPHQESHPSIIQKEMDKANKEAKAKAESK